MFAFWPAICYNGVAMRRARRNRSEIIFPMEAIMSNTTPFLQRLADWNQGMNDVPRRLLIIAAVALAC